MDIPTMRRLAAGRGAGLLFIVLVGTTALALALLLCWPIAMGHRVSSARAAVSYSSDEVEFVRLLNEYRAGQGLGRLLVSDLASDAAKKHSSDMATYDFFSHVTRQSDWFADQTTFSERMTQCGYTGWSAAGENIAAGRATAAEVFRVWKNSPPHNVNMLNPNFKVIGIGLVDRPASTYRYYWTTDFGNWVDATAHDLGDGSTTTQPAPTTTRATTTTTQPTTTTRSITTTTQSTTTTTARTTTTTTTSVVLSPFTDVPADHRFFHEITVLAEANIIGGYSDHRFCPEDLVTRAQFAKIVVGAVGGHTDDLETTTATFLDVPDNGEVYPFDYVEEAFALGIVKGLKGGLFGPDRSITRAQLALMTVRAGSGVLVDPPAAYRDGFSDVPGFAADAVRIARYNGVLSGKNDSTFDPYGFATRGQVAKMTWNLMELLY